MLPCLPFSFGAFCIILCKEIWEGRRICLWAQSFRTVLLWGHKKKKLSLWFPGGYFAPCIGWNRWNISSCVSLMFPAASGVSSSCKGGCRKGERKERTDLEFIADLLCVRHLEDQLLKSATQPLHRGMIFHFIDEETKPSVQFDSASSSQLPSGMVQLWHWNPGLFDQKWGISWLNPSLPPFLLHPFSSSLPPPFLSSFRCLETNSDTS